MVLLNRVFVFISMCFLVSCHHKLKLKKKLSAKHKAVPLKHRALDPSMVVETENGKVLGNQISPNLYAYRGIPFAKPPIGDLRFAPPQSPNNWTGTWNASYDRNSCLQTNISSLGSLLGIYGSEDCLYINVYLPLPKNENASLPVMVWIYGGAFIFGSSNYSMYGPDELVSEGVIVVSFNYRLGIFGFFSTEDNAAPGNYGLKDQIFALQWVQRNIAAFGGNPNQVTIFGESAGGASVSYLVTSPAAKGLFVNAISQSGTALCPWALSHVARDTAYAVGAKLGMNPQNSEDLVEQLRKVNYQDLQRAALVVMGLYLAADPLNGLVYAPVIEPLHEGAVVIECPYDSLQNGNFNQVKQIIGYNSFEALGFSRLIQLFELYLATYDLFPSRLVPTDMNALTGLYPSIGMEIKIHYAGVFGRLSFPSNNFSRYLSDDEFVRPIQRAANLSADYVNSTYLYKFSYKADLSAEGVGHAEDLRYLFNSNYTSTRDLGIKDCMTKLWTNFAKSGDPTPPNSDACGGVMWDPLGQNGGNEMVYLDIDSTATSDVNPNSEDMSFWVNLYNKYGNPPYCTF